MHSFNRDFYGYEMRAIVLGYIRPELNYSSRGKRSLHDSGMIFSEEKTTEGLINDIDTDKRVALRSLERPGYQRYAQDSHFNKPAE